MISGFLADVRQKKLTDERESSARQALLDGIVCSSAIFQNLFAGKVDEHLRSNRAAFIARCDA